MNDKFICTAVGSITCCCPESEYGCQHSNEHEEIFVIKDKKEVSACKMRCGKDCSSICKATEEEYTPFSVGAAA